MREMGGVERLLPSHDIGTASRMNLCHTAITNQSRPPNSCQFRVRFDCPIGRRNAYGRPSPLKGVEGFTEAISDLQQSI